MFDCSIRWLSKGLVDKYQFVEVMEIDVAPGSAITPFII